MRHQWFLRVMLRWPMLKNQHKRKHRRRNNPRRETRLNGLWRKHPHILSTKPLALNNRLALGRLVRPPLREYTRGWSHQICQPIHSHAKRACS